MLKKLLLSLLGALAVLAAVAWWLTLPPTPPARQVFVGGTVLTMGPENEVAEAVALEGERIVAVGSRAEIEALIESDTVVHDLDGGTLIPGFIDAHGHFPGSGFAVVAVDLNSPPIGKITNFAEMKAALQEAVDEKAAGEWIMAFGYDDTLLAEMRHPNRHDLDEVSSEHPMLLMHVSGHLAVANSLALEIAGYDSSTPDPVGGVIVRDENGDPTGLLEENATLPVQKHVMGFSLWDGLAMIQHAVAEYAAVGVTTAQSGAVDPNMASGIVMAARAGLIPFRVVIWPLFNELGPDLLSGEAKKEDYEAGLLWVGAIKHIADGSIQGYTGYLSEPYHVPFHGDASYRGTPRIPRDELVESVMKYHAAGYQLAIHGNGDASIDDIIYAFGEAQKKHPREDPRAIVIHAQMARDDQLDRMKELGLTPSFFSAHTYYWGDRHWNIFMGPERAARMSPTRSALDRDLRFTVHLDTPVTPMDPLMAVWATSHRISSGGKVIGAEQRVSVMQALRAVTIDAAWQIFRDDELGSVEVGKLADLVVLDRNPLDDPASIRDIQIQKTIVGGVTIYDRTADG